MKRRVTVGGLLLLLVLQVGTVFGSMAGETVRLENGWLLQVTRSVGMKGTERYPNGYQAPFRIFQKIEFVDQISQTDGKVIQEVKRTVKTAEYNSLDPESGQMVKQELLPSGSRFRIVHSPYGSTLYDGQSNEEIWDEEKVSTFSPPVVPNLWPEGELHRGQKWSYRGNELTARIALLDILGGKIDLSVEDIKEDPYSQLMVTMIRGRLQTKVDLGTIVLDFNADVSIDLPVTLGVPFMVKFEGILQGSGTTQDQWGQSVAFQIEASGSYLQVAKPSREILSAFESGSDMQDDSKEEIVETVRIDESGAIRIPLNNDQSSRPVVPQNRGDGGPVYQYRLYQDATDNAFTVMIPQGWQVRGGIMRIAPNQIRTVVDGCGKKLHFTIYDPESQASITYFPTEMYASSAPGTTFITIPAGQVLNGMVQMPQLLSPSQFVQQVVFPGQRAGVQNIQWGKVESLNSLAAAWNTAFHAEDQIPPQIVAESIEVAYDRGDIRFGELWTSLITSVSVYNSTIWMPDFTVVASVPLDKADQLAPVLKAVITSFRMNSSWLAKTSAAFDQCTKKVVISQEQIRARDRKIARKLRQVQQEINRIDNDIVSSRNNTRSVIQEHEHNTLMGEDKYEDTETGTRYLIDMGYERNYSNGDQIIQTNDLNYEPPAGYRDMKNIQITDE